jgi:DNA-binding transcriptional LysR family regulator
MTFSADQLAVFAAVVEHGTVSAAARELSVTQPAVSARLRSLQTLAGKKLYTPTTRGIVLTEAGEALLPHARAVARAMQRARRAVATPTGQELGCVLAVSEAAVPLALPRAAAALLTHPDVDLRVIPCDATSAVQRVIAGDADLAVAVGSPERPEDDLTRRPVLVDQIVMVHAGDLPQRIGLARVQELTVVWQAIGSGVRATVERVFEAAGRWPARSIEIGSTLGVVATVAAGQGVGFLSRRFCTPYVQADMLTIAAVDAPDMVARFDLISAPLADLPPAARVVADAILGADPALT